jgi:hypothetical protein
MPPVNDAEEADIYIVGFKKRQPYVVARSWCETTERRREYLDKERNFAKRQKTQAISKEPLVMYTNTMLCLGAYQASRIEPHTP